MMTNRTLLVRAMTFVIVAFAACGSDDPKPGGDGTTGDTTAPDTAVDDVTSEQDTAEDTTVTDTAIEDTTAEDTSVVDTSVDDTTVEDTTVEDTIITDTAADTGGETSDDRCDDDDDCIHCAYDEPIASEADCYCVLCPFVPLSAAECQARNDAWQTHCAAWATTHPCPVPSCIFLPPPICDRETSLCIDDPNTCKSDDDCQVCLHTTAPTSPKECQCPTCGAPLTRVQCEANEAAVATHCEGLLDDCIPPPCPAPPPVQCTFGVFRCEYGDSPP